MSSQIAEIAEIVMGQSPLGDSCNAIGVGSPLLNGPTEFGTYHPSPVQFTTAATKFAEAGDLLFCVRGSTTGKMNWADQRYAIGRGIAAIRHKSGARFQPLLRGIIECQLPTLLAMATGSTFPNVTGHMILGLTAPAMSLRDQEEAAAILGSLDDKIELNRRTNETLEAMAQAIFRDWFVDFGPTRRKIDGANGPVEIMGGLVSEHGRARELAALFPVAIEDTGLPSGWRQETLDDIAQRSSGTVQTGPFGSQLHQADYKAEGTPVVMPTNLTYSGFREGKMERIGRETANRLSRHFLATGDIVYGRRGDIGRKALIGEDQAGWICGTGCLKVSIPSSALPPEFLFYWLDQEPVLGWIRSRAIGATMPNLNTSTLGGIYVLVPPQDTLVAFSAAIRPLRQRISLNLRQVQTLSATRDLLLPKLMSGEISLTGARAQAEEAA